MITANDKKIEDNFSIEKLTAQQLINLAIDSHEDRIGLESRTELIRRGADDIEVRITIKKACKATVLSYEQQIKNSEESSLKSKFLASVSILDKLQLEWQKKDLILRIH